jgi:carboxylesterase type B
MPKRILSKFYFTFFQEPVPLPAWEGIMDGSVDGSVCPQLHIATNNVIGSEDCLSLNIFTPDVSNFFLLFS